MLRDDLKKYLVESRSRSLNLRMRSPKRAVISATVAPDVIQKAVGWSSRPWVRFIPNPPATTAPEISRKIC